MNTLQVVSQRDVEEEQYQSKKRIEAMLRARLERYAQLREEIIQLMGQYGEKKFRSNHATVSYCPSNVRMSMKVEDVIQLADEYNLVDEFEQLTRYTKVKGYWTIKTVE
jgi:hypothetical protein